MDVRDPPVLIANYLELKDRMIKALLAMDLLRVPLVFIDEYSFNKGMVKPYNWKKK